MIWMHNSEVNLENIISHLPIGASFESIGPGADIQQVSKALKGKAAFSGNLDPLEVLWKGTPELVRSETTRIITSCKENGGYIFNTGEMNPRQVKAENMKAMMDTARHLSEY
jgi:uroporphyrinogen-III decarboxylase